MAIEINKIETFKNGQKVEDYISITSFSMSYSSGRRIDGTLRLTIEECKDLLEELKTINLN